MRVVRMWIVKGSGDDLELKERCYRDSEVSLRTYWAISDAHYRGCSWLRVVAGWKRDAVSIIPPHTDLDMDYTVDPSVQQHLNVSNFEVRLSRPHLDAMC